MGKSLVSCFFETQCIVSFFCKCCHFLVLLKNVQVRKQAEKKTVYVIETG